MMVAIPYSEKKYLKKLFSIKWYGNPSGSYDDAVLLTQTAPCSW